MGGMGGPHRSSQEDLDEIDMFEPENAHGESATPNYNPHSDPKNPKYDPKHPSYDPSKDPNNPKYDPVKAFNNMNSPNKTNNPKVYDPNNPYQNHPEDIADQLNRSIHAEDLDADRDFAK